jgi:hypothetical protein
MDAIRVEDITPQNHFEDRSDVENHASHLSLVATHETDTVTLAWFMRADTPEAGLNRALIAVLTLPNGPGSDRRVLELASRMEQIDREHANQSAGPTPAPMVVSDRIVDSIAAVLATESKADIVSNARVSVVDHRAVSRSDQGYEAKGEFGPSERRTA